MEIKKTVSAHMLWLILVISISFISMMEETCYTPQNRAAIPLSAKGNTFVSNRPRKANEPCYLCVHAS